MFLVGRRAAPGRVRVHAPRRPAPRRCPTTSRERVLLAVDCANESRIGRTRSSSSRAPLVARHRPPPRQHALRRRQPDRPRRLLDRRGAPRRVRASSDVELTPEIAEALYIALVTDTGRFQYTNTTPKALRLAAELVEAGADVHRVFQDVYESVEFAKLKLLARALERAQVYEGGRLVVSYLLRSDFTEVGAAEPYSEGIIDYLRAVEGAEMAALIREPPRADGPTRRVSLRVEHDELDVSAIARKSGGGGHRQAAGFSSEESIEEITEFIRREFVARVPPRALEPRGSSSSTSRRGRRRSRSSRELRRRTRRTHRPCGHARPVRDGPAARVVRLGN